MRFEPIKTLPAKYPPFIEEACNLLVKQLDVKSWCRWYRPGYASELERFLLYGRSQRRRNDFFHIYSSEYDRLAVFDHDCYFKAMGGQFVLTMPYGTIDGFYSEFKKFKDAYYFIKEAIADEQERSLGTHKYYPTEQWWGQLHCKPRMTAAILPDRFKIRENGDFAAIIGMDSTLHYLSEGWGLPLVSIND